ncbi:MAG: 4-(cytidine 5'-diphospho)-2-C-methyl-D-erythritol kinase [Saccharofermentans sp.]|nr:4-(cytidine 5'-diphospho)-2-C-methyl-D-erythritol kinase [Saccharofermentans sp.]
MSHTYSTKAYAKINLFLRICGKYPNGYHRLFTLMQEISLADDIYLTADPDEEDEIVVANMLPGLKQEDDLCYKAACKYLDKIDAKGYGRITINVNKNIPSQAGLGGGSSDAASVIKLLQKRFKNPLTGEELNELGASLGADVPFFFTGKSAFCEGIGEQVTSCRSLAGMHLVMVKPDAGVSTPVCFKMCDESPAVFDEDEYKREIKNTLDKEGRAEDRVRALRDILTNDMQGPACELLPAIDSIIEDMSKTNPIYTAMSGSGSSVFAIYDSEEERDNALTALKEIYKDSGYLLVPCETV